MRLCYNHLFTGPVLTRCMASMHMSPLTRLQATLKEGMLAQLCNPTRLQYCTCCNVLKSLSSISLLYA